MSITEFPIETSTFPDQYALDELSAVFAQPSIYWTYPGPVGEVSGGVRLYLQLNGQITNVHASCGTAPDSGNVVVDVFKNGSTVYTTALDRPAVGASGVDESTPNVTSVLAGDYLEIHVVDAGTLAEDLVVRIDLGP